MKVFGIDPGIGTTGTAIISEEKNKFSLLFSKAITTEKNLPPSQRLGKLYEEITSIIKKQKPEAAALETLFFGTNITTAFSVGQARGVILLALNQNNIPVYEYHTMNIKQAITGHGGSSKGQIQKMVSTILKLSHTLTPDDVADGAAAALTHCFSYKLRERISMKKNK